MQQLTFDAEAVPDALGRRIHRLARPQIDADHMTVLGLGLQRDQAILDVKAGVGEERLGRDEQRVGKDLHAVLGPPLRRPLDLARQVRRAGQLERARARDDAAILERVLDRAQTIADRIIDLGNRVRVGPCGRSASAQDRRSRTLDEQSDALGLADLLDEGKLLLASSTKDRFIFILILIILSVNCADSLFSTSSQSF